MDLLTIAVGAVLIFYAGYTLVVRITRPQKLIKLDAMQERFGARAGLVMHIVAYTIMPALFGLLLVVAGFNGVSLLNV